MPETPTIPGYTIERKLGQGGMASVYLAIQESFGRAVALKVMSPELSADPSFATRFMREARIVANLSHASIVPVFEVGEHGSVYYLSMEYLPAGDLKSRIQQGEGNVALAIDVCMAVCSALDVAHRKGFVHRDIKPENIMFREDGTPVVTDFGIARAVDSGNALTMAGMMVGTPAYMSPEQVRGQELDGRSDLYSVGVVFYEILTGGLPFEADSSLSVALKHLSDRLPPLPAELAEYQEFFERLTAKNRESRFPTGADVVRALRSLAPARDTEITTLVRPRLTQPLISEPPPPAVPQPAAPGFVPAPAKTPEKKPLPFRPQADAPFGKAERPLQPRTRSSPGPRTSGYRPGLRQATTRTGTEVLRRIPGLVGEVRTALRRDGPARNSVGWVAAGALTAAATVGVWLLLMNGSEAPRPAVAQSPPAITEEVARQQPAGTRQSTESAASRNSANSLAQRSSESASSVRLATLGNPTPVTPAQPGPRPEMREREHPVPTPPAQRPGRPTPEESPRQAHNPQSTARLTLEEQQHQAKIQREAELLQQQRNAARVRELLAAARTSIVTGALLAPNGNCARDQYLAILQLRPKLPEALEGTRRLAALLVEEASRYEAFGDIYNSAYMINQVRMLQPANPRLGPLQEKLAQLQTKQIKLDPRDKTHLEHVENYVSRAHDRLRRLPFDAHAVGDATDLYDAAMAEEPNAPGLPSLRNQLIAAYPQAVQTERSMRDFHNATMLIEAARKHGWTTNELERAAKSPLPRLPSAARATDKPAGSP